MNGNCTATSVQLICFCLPISVLLLETKERIQLKKESIGHNNVSPPVSFSDPSICQDSLYLAFHAWLRQFILLLIPFTCFYEYL